MVFTSFSFLRSSEHQSKALMETVGLHVFPPALAAACEEDDVVYPT